MAKKIADDLYTASATPPGVDEAWSTVEPLNGDQISNEFRARGGHPVDIADALNEQDFYWAEKLKSLKPEEPKQ